MSYTVLFANKYEDAAMVVHEGPLTEIQWYRVRCAVGTTPKMNLACIEDLKRAGFKATIEKYDYRGGEK